jgi:hypothetical protein
MKTTKHSAPGPMAGYNYEYYRALYWLAISSSSSLVGIETEDDIVIKDNNGNFIFEQDKHSLTSENYNPLSDNSYALWNSLFIWIKLIKDQKIDIEKCKFYLVTNKLVPDCFVKRVSTAESEEDFDELLHFIRTFNAKISEKVLSIVHEINKLNDRLILSVLKRVTLIDKSKIKNIDTLKSDIIDNLPIPSSVLSFSEQIFFELIGWLKQMTMQSWYLKRPAIIKGQSFFNAVDSAIRSRIRERSLERSSHLIEVPQEQVLKHRGSVFVKQLSLITEDTGEIDDAIHDFIKASKEFLRLSEEGELTPIELKSFQNNLFERWKSIFRRVIRIRRNVDDEEKGYIIYHETTDEYLAQIKDRLTEHFYFTRGAYHRLSDELKVGWHPNYIELIK